MTSIRIAVEGCGHGTLHAIYASVERSCKEKGWPDVDLLIICGDFQSVRNAFDLNCVAMPAKYREMCDFHEYYSGARKAPYPTIFVGGNHEASNYLFELYYGGWVADNIYYMGAANVLNFGPIRIAGMSGIWKGYNYNKPHHERLPYNADDLKSVYHVRDIDARKLLQVTGKVDIGISHDWPRGVEWMGDWKALFRRKEHLEPDARNGQLGNVAAKNVLDALQPNWWFSAHLHCKYAAIVDHARPSQTLPAPVEANGTVKLPNTANNDLSEQINADEIDLELSDEPDPIPHVHNADEIDLEDDEPAPQVHNGDESKPNSAQATDAREEALKNGINHLDQKSAVDLDDHSHGSTQSEQGKVTHFLALDKCLAGRHFLQLLDVPADHKVERPVQLSYDREWLAISRAFALTEPILLGEPKFNAPKAKLKEQYRILIEEQMEFVGEIPEEKLVVPQNFSRTAPVYDGGNIHDPRYNQAAGGLREYTNPQTAQFCELLELPNPFDISEEERDERMQAGPRPSQHSFDNGGHTFRGGRGGRPHRGRGRGESRGGRR